MCRPWSTMSSPVFTMAVTSGGGTTSIRPRRKRAAPTPPARAVITRPTLEEVARGGACCPAMSLRVAVDATPLAGARTGVGMFVGGMLPALAARGDADLVAYGLTWRGRSELPGVLPAGAAPAPAARAAG